jgi:hypothetical protein
VPDVLREQEVSDFAAGDWRRNFVFPACVFPDSDESESESDTDSDNGDRYSVYLLCYYNSTKTDAEDDSDKMESESDNDNDRGQETRTKSGAKAECCMRAFERSPSSSSLPPSSCTPTLSHHPQRTLKITGCQLEAEKATRKEEAEKRALSSYNVFM